MAILKPKDILKLSPKEKEKKLDELRKELMKLKSQISMGNLPESPGKVRAIRRTIARILTLSKERRTLKNK
ncbi:50S ribosomal protein L29 [Candidatus Woesearchaeota archaeon]|nr:50S ribosomal protein L29 [Candidatus Woesearchaeota archaeon]